MRRFHGWMVWLAAVVFAVAAHGQAKKARPQVVRPDGAVWSVIQENCISCHGIDDYAYNALDRAGWDAHLTAKHRGIDLPLPPPAEETPPWEEVRTSLAGAGFPEPIEASEQP